MTVATHDERIKRSGTLGNLLRPPEMGAVAGLILVMAMFAFVASATMFAPRGVLTWITVSAQLGVVATAACLLMIAGEFDLSIGSMIAFSGMIMALLVKFGHLPAWGAILLGFAIAIAIGWTIGTIVVRSGLPSFIVSLAFLFVLRGATIVSARTLNGSTLVEGMRDFKNTDFVAWLFGGEIRPPLFGALARAGVIQTLASGAPTVPAIPMIVVWCVGLGAAASVALSNTRFGNWIMASGGDESAARSLGVPVNRAKITLFMFSAFCAAVFGASQVFDFASADAGRGQLKEFEAIIAAVIGGTFLTVGYGTVVGALLGPLMFGIVSQGFFFTGIDGDWFRIFLGCVLFSAVFFNTYIRKPATGGA